MNIYEKIKLDHDMDLKFQVIEVGRNKQGIVDKHWHRSIEILVPIEGNLFVWISGETKEVKKGQMFIINSKEIHSVYGKKNEKYKGYIMQISYDFLLRYCSNIDSIYFDQVRCKDINRKLLGLLEDIKDCYSEDDEHKKLKIEGLLLIFVHILLSKQKRIRKDSKAIESDKNRKRIITITNYIEKHYKEALSVHSLAYNFNLSYGYFVRLFKKNLNMTVMEYITNLRLNKSREDLVNTDYTIVQIALENGFPNIQSFYKEFKKVYNITPSIYRKKSQINNKEDII